MYKQLEDELQAALMQASGGKGKERHANGLPFGEQFICTETRSVGLGFPIGQARKKALESLTLLKIKGPEAAIHELHGAINYLAAACIVLREQAEQIECPTLTLRWGSKEYTLTVSAMLIDGNIMEFVSCFVDYKKIDTDVYAAYGKDETYLGHWLYTESSPHSDGRFYRFERVTSS